MAKSSKEITVSKGKLERLPRVVSPFEEMDRMFDSLWRGPLRPFGGWQRPFAELPAIGPNVDVIDRDDEVVVRAEVPGFSKEDIEVSTSGDILTIQGALKTEEKEEKGNYHRCEIFREAFSRTLQLPAAVDESKAKATMKDGMLELTLPKLEKSKRHAIRID
jgi:HSP20 family protein